MYKKRGKTKTQSTTRAIETIETIDAPHHLVLDEDETKWLQEAAANPAFDFLKDPEEDIYTLSDGRPFYDEG